MIPAPGLVIRTIKPIEALPPTASLAWWPRPGPGVREAAVNTTAQPVPMAEKMVLYWLPCLLY